MYEKMIGKISNIIKDDHPRWMIIIFMKSKLIRSEVNIIFKGYRIYRYTLHQVQTNFTWSFFGLGVGLKP